MERLEPVLDGCDRRYDIAGRQITALRDPQAALTANTVEYGLSGDRIGRRGTPTLPHADASAAFALFR